MREKIANEMIGKVGPRRVKRLMKKMGMSVQEVPDVQEVTIRSKEKEIVITGPLVTEMRMGKGERSFQVTGGEIAEKELEGAISKEDAQLVAQQANVSLEEAIDALRRTEGDLARAIILLKSKKT